MKSKFNHSSGQNTPQEIAAHCLQETLALREARGSALLTMGEHHERLPHQITQASAIKQLSESGLPTTFFIELPHDRLHTMLHDRGYSDTDARALYDYISENDPKGHITAKAMIGANLASLKGGFFINYEAQVSLHAAIVNDANIRCVDASRTYPKDYIMNYDDALTSDTADDIGARKGIGEAMGADDMLLRNTIMARLIKETLQDGHVGVMMTGGAHVFGMSEPKDKQQNVQTPYSDSLAAQFEQIGIPSVMLYMIDPPYLPEDYGQVEGRQDLFLSPPMLKEARDITNEDIIELFENNDLDPDTYDPRHFHEQYRVEFNNVLKEAEDILGIAGPEKEPPVRTVLPNLKTIPYSPVN